MFESISYSNSSSDRIIVIGKCEGLEDSVELQSELSRLRLNDIYRTNT